MERARRRHRIILAATSALTVAVAVGLGILLTRGNDEAPFIDTEVTTTVPASSTTVGGDSVSGTLTIPSREGPIDLDVATVSNDGLTLITGTVSDPIVSTIPVLRGPVDLDVKGEGFESQPFAGEHFPAARWVAPNTVEFFTFNYDRTGRRVRVDTNTGATIELFQSLYLPDLPTLIAGDGAMAMVDTFAGLSWIVDASGNQVGPVTDAGIIWAVLSPHSEGGFLVLLVDPTLDSPGESTMAHIDGAGRVHAVSLGGDLTTEGLTSAAQYGELLALGYGDGTIAVTDGTDVIQFRLGLGWARRMLWDDTGTALFVQPYSLDLDNPPTIMVCDLTVSTGCVPIGPPAHNLMLVRPQEASDEILARLIPWDSRNTDFAIWPFDTAKAANEGNSDERPWLSDPSTAAIQFARDELGWQDAAIAREDDPSVLLVERNPGGASVYVETFEFGSAAGVGGPDGIWLIRRVWSPSVEFDPALSIRDVDGNARADVHVAFAEYYDGLRAASATVVVGYQNTEWTETVNTGEADFELSFFPEGPGHILILFYDAAGEILGAWGAPLPAGGIVAG
jgi:hypothetical protein